MQTVIFQDTGIDVIPFSINQKIKVCGDILDCKTNELLDGVSATLYDNTCKVIETRFFDWRYEFKLSAGTYTVLFEKQGYVRKFLTLILQSDMDITADVNMRVTDQIHLQNLRKRSGKSGGRICKCLAPAMAILGLYHVARLPSFF